MLSFLNPLPRLPEYTGPEKVGTAEYELSLSSLGFECIPEQLPASTIKFRIFYPARLSADAAFGVPWLPQPQTAHLGAYLRMARLEPWLSKILLSVPFYLRSTMMPAYKNAALQCEDGPLPVLIFSHGLVGGMNSHSALLGELASRGIFCVAIDHRDGSGVLSLARREGSKVPNEQPTEITSVYFKNVSLKIRPGVWEARDRQFEIRLFELMATYKALGLLNEGKHIANLADDPGNMNVIPSSSLNLNPGEVIWAGHSFGGATMVQFIKTIYHESRLQGVKQESDAAFPEHSLLLQPAPRSLVEQIKATSPVILLDPWFMPLRSPRTKWLNLEAPSMPRRNIRSGIWTDVDYDRCALIRMCVALAASAFTYASGPRGRATDNQDRDGSRNSHLVREFHLATTLHERVEKAEWELREDRKGRKK
ncbi:uncharacterized protein A1O9_09328 [Exophiala aquamarina CBS 119918]|uniref:1-alkyl-2-acetylglycerophosphocholine esterase n=1 Tax=Exophiala aquamarina CBS 119918 TaxID=1182545 RepID=A0A072PH90_9EURO|nr:uncharacterized protein A1O9_09328 [Exophiala aquamarina CBS 119918]KEF54885.1 hypothetical protein A1O9_09328 [Exophiala aquamarina CBS 119918]